MTRYTPDIRDKIIEAATTRSNRRAHQCYDWLAQQTSSNSGNDRGRRGECLMALAEAAMARPALFAERAYPQLLGTALQEKDEAVKSWAELAYRTLYRELPDYRDLFDSLDRATRVFYDSAQAARKKNTMPPPKPGG